ncbi:hypothetical protein Dsin_027125 [Dipteronia sinensis]|uniref:Uncharacterized protein n=1 Tax=Dipteronia sinensis TaxID=43782 RepID=A0AAD9ZYW8_9ROSI|nr:hypothetical protein Dsin_027125 [Dipteronia sinensis]
MKRYCSPSSTRWWPPPFLARSQTAAIHRSSRQSFVFQSHRRSPQLRPHLDTAASSFGVGWLRAVLLPDPAVFRLRRRSSHPDGSFQMRSPAAD